MAQAIARVDPALLDIPLGKQRHAAFKKGGDAAIEAFDSARFGEAMPEYAAMTVTNRAYTSPIWYSPTN